MFDIADTRSRRAECHGIGQTDELRREQRFGDDDPRQLLKSHVGIIKCVQDASTSIDAGRKYRIDITVLIKLGCQGRCRAPHRIFHRLLPIIIPDAHFSRGGVRVFRGNEKSPVAFSDPLPCRGAKKWQRPESR
uniref:Uncharacterized protein n=1 Tax=Rhodocyclus tenuis TaxID=1066 RepID=A0A840G8P7_RHOTE|nr:hypothetical protein [Rhodocyclus tenuis]